MENQTCACVVKPGRWVVNPNCPLHKTVDMVALARSQSVSVGSSAWLDRFDRLSTALFKWPKIMAVFCMGMMFAVGMMVILYILTEGK